MSLSDLVERNTNRAEQHIRHIQRRCDQLLDAIKAMRDGSPESVIEEAQGHLVDITLLANKANRHLTTVTEYSAGWFDGWAERGRQKEPDDSGG